MITGFNTDIEHGGVVYHVQTEDKGLETPFILSLVYVGGAILASKRAPYDDLLAAGFDAGALAERLQRQHKLLCAAITAGRIEDLKRLGQREPAAVKATKTAAAAPPPPPPAAVTVVGSEPIDPPTSVTPDTLTEAIPPPPPPAPSAPPEVPVVAAHEFVPAEALDALNVNLLEERDFRGGEVVTLRIRVSRGPLESRQAAPSVPVTVKILGTEFRPLILTAKTDNDGVAVVHSWLPRFSKGRAAVLIRAVADGYTAELRRIIQPG